jgi:predicted phage terminase large subunit-like protein
VSDDWDEIRRQMLGYYAPDLTTTERYDSPLDLARALDPSIVRTPALELINQALVDLMDTPDGRLIISMPPQEGKTTLVKALVEWVLRDTPDTRVAVTSNDYGLAKKMGRALRDDIRDHASVLGLRLRKDVSAQAEFQILGRRGGVYAVGIGGGLTGRPVDLLVIDDPVKNRQQADSETYRQMAFDWWTDVASTRLAPGAPVVLVLTRWHEDDLAGRLTTGEDADRWTVLNIPAQADHNPEKGETDPLDREFGEYLESARGRTVEQWAAIKVQAGSRTWNALYQGRPSPAEGGMFKRDKWRFYGQPQWVEREDGSRIVTHCDDLLASWDMTFKDTDGTDFVVGQVWMRRGADAFLLDQVRARMSFVETCQQFRVFSAKWPQVVMKLIEDKANGPAVISALGRIVAGIIPEEPHGSKTARASAVSPLQEAGNVWLPTPELAPWVGDFVEECAGFPTATHDDQVDAMSQGLNRLVLQPLLAGQDLVTEDDLDDELAEFEISRY